MYGKFVWIEFVLFGWSKEFLAFFNDCVPELGGGACPTLIKIEPTESRGEDHPWCYHISF